MNSQVLKKNCGQVSGDIRAAVRLHRQGHLDAARRIYTQILAHCPEHSDALHLLGVMAHQAGEYANAIQLISRAVRLDPGQASYYLNLGNAYRDSNLLGQAATCFRKAIELKPDYAAAYFNLANCLSVQGELDSAARNYEYALKLKPDLTEALLNLAEIFEQQDSPDKAIACYRRVLSLKPDCADACVRLGSIYQRINDHAEAIRLFKSASSADLPESHRIYNNIGVSQRALENADDAVDCFRKALTLNPAYAPACYNLGIEYHLKGELEASIQCLERAVTLSPDHGDALNLLVHLLQRTCAWRKLEIFAAGLDRSTAAALQHNKPAAEAVYANVLRHPDPGLNFMLAQNRSEKIVRQLSGTSPPKRYARPAGEHAALTLGYFSADFRNHPIGHLIGGLFARHDRSQVKVNCYSYGRDDGSAYRRRIMQDCDRFVDVRQMSDREIAERIYADKVCILIDLMGHTAGSRLGVCALRPAPVQVTYLGFPGTSGADFFDYIITDRIVSPEEHAPYYSEKPVYMPHCYQINNNGQEISARPRQRPDCGLPPDGFVFASFNQAFKIDAVMFSVWLKLLQKTPASVLWLLWDNAIAAANLKKAAYAGGVDPDRLVFAEKLNKEDHLARMRLSDLALDTRIYGGHTTTSDALWAGVPVIALLGTHFASRVSSSLLLSIGLPQLVTASLEDYEARAVYLARNPAALKKLREKLARNRLTAPLFDTDRFVKNLESAFREMWDAYQRGKPPQRIDVLEQT